MSYPKLRIDAEHAGQVVWTSLDAPPGHILDIEMVESLRALLRKEGRAHNVKCLVFRGSGDHFSFGASIEQHQPGQVEQLLPSFHDLFRELLEVSRPTLAVVEGRCLGGGLELAAACNWIFASPTATFGVPEVKLGVFPPLASILLPERIGRPRAEELCITGRIVDAEEALDTGLIDYLSEEPDSAARQWIERELLPQSAVALRYATRAVRASLRERVGRELDALERLYLEELMRHEDPREGIQAFLAKRRAAWKNR
jgi:cyclohexa-1,5-dienecarbonyl-CoA hydratase